MAATSTLPNAHALVLPLPVQGHINPLLSLSIQLALRGVIITFVNTESSHKRMLKTQNSQTLGLSDPAVPDKLPVDIRFVTIPDESPDEALQFAAGSEQKIAGSVLEVLKGIKKQQGLIEKIIESSKDDFHPISCIIADKMFPWTQDLADKEGIGRVVFWTSNGTSLGLLLRYKKTGNWSLTDHNSNDDESEEVYTGGLRIRNSEFLSTVPLKNVESKKLVCELLARTEEAVCIAVNTFEELESFNLEVSADYSTPVRYVGPLMPFELTDVTQSKPLLRGNLFKEEDDCLPWLSKQKPASVLYVCFGSVAALTAAQIEELALGIEESKQPFLWVARANIKGGTVFPEGFIERTRDRGLVIAWAPQLKVLEHPAVGSFVTHCGWNSTLESLYMGVPLLCLAISADQPMNEALIAKQWRAGIAMAKGEDGLVRKEEVVRAVKSVMESQDVRGEAARWKVLARQALMEGASSYNALTGLIADIQRPNQHA